MYMCVCARVYIGSVDARQLYIAVIYLHPYTKLFSGSPIVGRPQGCTFPQELYKCNAAATFTSIPPYIHLPLSIGRLANGINPLWPLFLKRNTRNGYKRYLVNFLSESSHKCSYDTTNEVKFNKLKTIK